MKTAGVNRSAFLLVEMMVSVVIFSVTKFRAGQQTMTFASTIFILLVLSETTRG